MEIVHGFIAPFCLVPDSFIQIYVAFSFFFFSNRRRCLIPRCHTVG
uniref:Uncharacterized protein n=2 Tax=Anguilla anguilla TaxID=7936 RepID=A0A0E9R789_ANGAN